MDKESANTLASILGYTFQDKKLLDKALTHPSALAQKKHNYDFERLEFLGDRVLGLIIANYLYQQYPKEKEGVLARYQAVLVSRDTCRKIGENIGLIEFIKYNVTDYQSKNTALIANAMEAILGAMFLDGGMEPCEKFIYKHWSKDLIQKQQKDAKTIVQEWAQKKYNIVPEYILVERSGTAHSPTFQYKIAIPPNYEAIGIGNNRKQAEQDAAQKFIEKYKLKTT